MRLATLRATTRAALSLASALCLTAHATAVPTVVQLGDGISFAEYAGSAPVGGGQVEDSRSLFFIDEKTIDGLKAWYVFHEGVGVSRVTATLDFEAPIVDVIVDRDALRASAAFESDAVRYVYRPFTGLESRQGDLVSFERGSTTLTLDFATLSPGDHVRVVTAVPEPGTTAMMAGGLAALLWLSRRRRPSA